MAGKDKAIVREQDYRAARLRSQGWTFTQIADEMGYANDSGAWKAVQRGLSRSVREPRDEARWLELDELDALKREAWTVLRREHYAVSFGKVATLEDGTPVLDDGPTLAAIDKLLKIQERRAKLLDLDRATSKSRVEVISESAVDKAIADLEAQIDARATEDRRPA